MAAGPRRPGLGLPDREGRAAHIATLKTIDPPLSALEGRKLAGAKRRAKRLLFPTEDGELVLLVHLMTAGRLRYLQAGEKGPKTPAFRLRFQGGAELVLTEAGRRSGPESGSDPGGSRSRAGAPRPGGARARRGATGRDPGERIAPAALLLRDQRVIAGIGRAWANEILHAAQLSPVRALEGSDARGGRASGGCDRLGALARPRAARARRERQADVPRPQQARRAVPRVRHADRPGRLRGAHDLLLPRVPDGRPRPERPPPLSPAPLTLRARVSRVSGRVSAPLRDRASPPLPRPRVEPLLRRDP